MLYTLTTHTPLEVGYVLCEQRDHHLDALVGALLVVVLGALDRVKQAVTVVRDTCTHRELFKCPLLPYILAS